MPARIKTRWNRLIDQGIRPDTAARDQKRIRLSNGICLITGLAAMSVSLCSMLLGYLSTGGFLFILVPGIIAMSSGLAAWSCILLNRWRLHTVSRYGLLAVWWITCSSFSLVYGREIRFDQYLMVIVVLPVALFDRKRDIFLGSGISLFFFAACQAWYRYFPPLIQTPPEFALYRQAVHTAFMLAALYAVVYYFRYQNEHSERLIRAEIKEREKIEAELRYLAYHDPLTGLSNRKSLYQRIDHNLTQSRRKSDKRVWALLYLDLDGFKEINDSLGHQVGDKVLMLISRRLTSCLRETDRVFRLGGDEFVVLLNDLARPGDAGTVARKLAKSVTKTLALDNRELEVGASVGIAIYPTDGDRADVLLNRADRAMYQAKARGGGYGFFQDGARAAGGDHAALVTP